MAKTTQLPCENCKSQSDRCSTDCKRLYHFLRWTDKNRANIRTQAREEHVTPEFLTVISNQSPDQYSWQDLITQTSYGSMDLSALKENEKSLFEAYYIEELSILEISDQLKLTPNAVHKRLSRIRKKLTEGYLIKIYPNTP